MTKNWAVALMTDEIPDTSGRYRPIPARIERVLTWHATSKAAENARKRLARHEYECSKVVFVDPRTR